MSFVMALFYLYYVEYHAWLWRLSLVIPIVFLNYTILTHATKIIQKRLQGTQIQLRLELMIAFGLLLGLGILFFMQKNIILVSIVIGFFTWLFIQVYLQNTGVFYVSFIGLLLFILVMTSYNGIHLQERLLFKLSDHYTAYLARRTLQQRKWQEQHLSDGKLYILESFLGHALKLHVPKNMWFHDSYSSGQPYGYPELGVALAYISASQQHLYAPPALGIYWVKKSQILLPPRIYNQNPNPSKRQLAHKMRLNNKELRRLVWQALEQRKMSGGIDHIRYEGLKTIHPVDLPAASNSYPIQAMQYTYLDLMSNEKMRLWLLFPQHTSKPLLAYLVSEVAPLQDRKDFHPSIFGILQGIQWQ